MENDFRPHLSSHRSGIDRESGHSTPSPRAGPAGEEQTIRLNATPSSELDREVKTPRTNPIAEVSENHQVNSQHVRPSKRTLIVGLLLKTISVGLYIFDFVSNILVAKHYYNFDYRWKNFEGVERDVSAYPESSYGFISMVVIMVIGHIGCGVMFMLEDHSGQEHPLCSAYFLPILQFRRLLRNAWSLSIRPRADNPRVEARYAIASAGTDGGPLFVIQYAVIALYTKECWPGQIGWTPTFLLLLSLVVSAVSATYNVVRALVFLVPLQSKWLGVPAGLFSLSALMLRCATLVSLLVSQIDSWHLKVTYTALGLYSVFIFFIPFIGFCWLTLETTSQRSFRTIANSTLRASGYTYLSVSFGPLYPLVSIARTSSRMAVSTRRFGARLLLFVGLHMTFEIISVLILFSAKANPCFTASSELDVIDAGWCSKVTPQSMFMRCSTFKVFLSCGMVVESLCTATFLILIREVVTDDLELANAPDGNTTLSADTAFEISEPIKPAADGAQLLRPTPFEYVHWMFVCGACPAVS